MFDKILVALDGSEASKQAFATAVELARAHGARLYAVGVEEHLPHYAATVGEVEEAKDERDRFLEGVMQDAKRLADLHGVPLITEVRAGNAPQQIVQVATAEKVDLVVVGAKGHSRIHDFLLGSTSDRVSHHAPCSVLVVR